MLKKIKREKMKYRLGDLCSIVSGSTPKTNVPEYWGGNLKWVTPAELSDDSYIVNDTVRKITELGVSKTALNSFPAGTVLLSSRAPIGKVAIAGCDMYCNQGFKNLICSSKIYNKYLFWFLKSKTDFLNLLGRGATFKEISKQIVSDIEIELPDFEKQVKVANIFEKISHLISLRNQQLEQLDLLVKSRFVEMFGDPVRNSKKWEVLSLQEMCSEIYGGGTPSKSHKEYYDNGNIPWVSAKDMKTEIISDSEIHINELGLANSSAKMIPVDSLIMVIRSGILKHTLPIAINAVPITVNQDLKAFIVNRNKINVRFLANSLKLQEKEILSFVRGVTADNLEFSFLKNRLLILPPLALQNQFAAFVEEVEKEKATVKQSLEWLNTLKAKLMQDYFG